MKIIIVGAGISGLATAVALQNIGLDVSIYDKNEGLEKRGAALTLWSNGTLALKKLNVLEDLLDHASSLSMANLYSSRGKLLETLTINYATPTVGILRYDLLRILAGKVGEEKIFWNKKLKNLTGNAVTFEDGTSVEADMVIAADGIHSVLRRQFVGDALQFSGYTSWRGISKTSVPSNYENTMTQIWGEGSRFGFVPLIGGRTYWFATANVRAGESQTHDITQLIGSFPDPVNKIFAGQEKSEIIHLDIYDRNPIRQWSYGHALLLGDSAHPMTPSLGLGACTALEDAVCLSECFSNSKSIRQIFNEFESKRVRRANQIVKLSRRIGLIGQMQHPLMCQIRNRMYPLVPRRWKKRIWDKLYGFEFQDPM
ncbi:FAD-dependent monooxygenase [Cohnella soli]|uniref:FAD-dependent monooxygenase n=1 Tax=Cohnella soli TaxID=425005 RepID=A0ABW0I162_9BACL